jgi:hypothetical protein
VWDKEQVDGFLLLALSLETNIKLGCSISKLLELLVFNFIMLASNFVVSQIFRNCLN